MNKNKNNIDLANNNNKKKMTMNKNKNNIDLAKPKSGALSFWLVLLICENIWACDPIKLMTWSAVNLKRTRDLGEFYTWARDTALWY